MMGLSDLPSKIQTTPYSPGTYYEPTYGDWKEWFAWYPVKKYYFKPHNTGLYPVEIKVYKWIWLKKIYRREVLHGPATVTVIHTWEYASLMELLTNGH